MAQLKSKSVQRLMANVMFAKADSTVSLHLFDDKLKQLHNIYQHQTNKDETFESVDDDAIMEFLLTVQASVFYNGKKDVLSVTEKDNELNIKERQTVQIVMFANSAWEGVKHFTVSLLEPHF